MRKHFATIADEKEKRMDSRKYWQHVASGYKARITVLENQLIKGIKFYQQTSVVA